MKKFRTDLAAEARSEYMSKYSLQHDGEIDGVKYSEKTVDGLRISEIDILNKNGEKNVGKKKGKYITVEIPDITVSDFYMFSKTCHACAYEIQRVCDAIAPNAQSLLVCGIGNEKMSPDSIGPCAIRHLLVTRQLKEQESKIFEKSGFFDVCAIAPGVGADTGLDASDVVRAVCSSVNPDIIIVIDALAAQSEARLCRTVQICTAGISPGSGVGNAVKAINKETVGVPVVGLGVPTVIDTGMLEWNENPYKSGFFVCPKEIDEQSAKLSKLLAFSINLAFHKNYPLEEMMF